MALIIVEPASTFKIRTSNWRQSGGVTYQRSDFTGRTRALRLGPAARWRCELELVPETGAPGQQLVASRAFLAAAARGDFGLKIPFFDSPQTATASCTSFGGTQAGFQINVQGLPASQTILPSGSIITLAWGVDRFQPCVLLANLVSNASGQGVLSMNQPAREPVIDGTVIILDRPFALMRAADALAWSHSPFQIHQLGSLQLEEVF